MMSGMGEEGGRGGHAYVNARATLCKPESQANRIITIEASAHSVMHVWAKATGISQRNHASKKTV